MSAALARPYRQEGQGTKAAERPSELDQVAATLEAMAAAVRLLDLRSREEAPALLKPEEVARRLSIGLSTVYRLVQEKSLRACRVADGAIRIAEVDLQKFIRVRTEVRA